MGPSLFSLSSLAKGYFRMVVGSVGLATSEETLIKILTNFLRKLRSKSPSMIKAIAIVGKFDDSGGRPSGYMAKLFNQGLSSKVAGMQCDVVNGGTYESLQAFFSGDLQISQYQVVFWFPDIPNDKPKFLNQIKKVNPHCIFVSSKNNITGAYGNSYLIAKALETKSNLLVVFSQDLKQEPLRWDATILDPLGNVFLSREKDINNVRAALYNRVVKLIGSRPVTQSEGEYFAK